MSSNGHYLRNFIVYIFVSIQISLSVSILRITPDKPGYLKSDSDNRSTPCRTNFHIRF